MTDHSTDALDSDSTPGPKRWLDHPRNVDRLCYALYAVCGLLFFVDLFYARETHFGFETWLPTGWSGFYGLVSCVGLVLAAKGLRRILMRPEDYYE
jgi:hypothetical protein